jgi:hypothetical protein
MTGTARRTGARPDADDVQAIALHTVDTIDVVSTAGPAADALGRRDRVDDAVDSAQAQACPEVTRRPESATDRGGRT